MPSLGDRMGSFMPRLRFLHKKPKEGSSPSEGGSFHVLPPRDQAPGASTSGFQVLGRARRPTASSADSVPTGWSLTPSLLSPHSEASPLTPRPQHSPRSGSPEFEGYQQATWGGEEAISPTEPRRLTVRNPDPGIEQHDSPSPTPSEARPALPGQTRPVPGRPALTRLQIPSAPNVPPPRMASRRLSQPAGLASVPEDRALAQPVPDAYSSQFTPGDGKPRPAFLPQAATVPGPERIPHPISLMPGMAPPAPQPWDPALFFQPHPPAQPIGPHGSGVTSPATASSSTAATRRATGNAPQTFADMGFVHVKTRKKWYHPGTWKDKPVETMHIDQVDSRKHLVLPPTPPSGHPPSPGHSAPSSSGGASSGNGNFGLDYYGI